MVRESERERERKRKRERGRESETHTHTQDDVYRQEFSTKSIHALRLVEF